MSSIVLEMTKITKTFPGVVALKDVNLKVAGGEVHALVGENGAGKSTLMKILNGVHPANSGNIFLEGQQVHFNDVLDAQEKGISIIFQEFNLVNTLSVAENIFLGRFNGSWKKIKRDAQELIYSLGFDFDVNRIVGTLSTAEKQLVEIAKALSYKAKIIVMDEPTSSLTKKETGMLFKIIEKLKKDNITTIYISHKLEEVFSICDTVTVLRDGSTILVSPVADITRDKIIEAMVGRNMDMEFPHRQPNLGDVVLSATQLSRKRLVEGISFDLRRGEVLGISGLVGAGRTELAEMIFGAARIDGGTLMVNGKQAIFSSTQDAIKNSVGMVTEDRKETGLVLEFSIKDNITITNLTKVMKNGLLNNKKEIDAANTYIEKLGIKTPSYKQKLNNLSGGNQQKVVLAKWLFSNVDILILDEPTRGIDVGTKYDIYCLINKLVSMGKSIIMISSELPEILGMSDRIMVMHNGRAKAILDNKDLSAEDIMRLAVD